MPIQVRYMGTKRRIAPHVADLVAEASDGPFLDLFSGICAVGHEVGEQRQIWCNDIQHFASSVAKAFFTSPEPPLNFDTLYEMVRKPFLENQKALTKKYAKEIEDERVALKARVLEDISILEASFPNVAKNNDLEKDRRKLAKNSSEFPYRLFTITFSGGYIGLRQAIEIDSLKCAFDALREEGGFSEYQHLWNNLALSQAVCKISTTTGHFAQFLRPKKENLRGYINQRSKSVFREWYRAILEFQPIGTKSWRKRNRVYRSEAIDLLESFSNKKIRPAVIYADPPYTDDQYSRYYHLLETLLFYDYPPSEGNGRYRPDRFRSNFSLKSQIGKEMNKLIHSASKLGSRLILSYPENGLIDNSKQTIGEMFKQHYGSAPKIKKLDLMHSSLGASKGQSQNQVKEIMFIAG